MGDKRTLFDMIRFYRSVLPIEMLVLKGGLLMIVDENRHGLLVKPCIDTLGRIAVLSDSYKNPSTNALNIVRFESSHSKKIPITYWISSHCTLYTIAPRLQSPILSQAATEDPS